MASWLMVLMVFQIILCYLLRFIVIILLPLLLELTILCRRCSHHFGQVFISQNLWLISILSIFSILSILLLIFFTSLPLFFRRSLISSQDHLQSFWLMAAQGTKIILT